MRYERLRWFQLISEYFRGSIKVLLPAIITAHGKSATDRGPVGNGVRYTKRDFVSVENMLSIVIQIVLTDHYPTILPIFPLLRIHVRAH